MLEIWKLTIKWWLSFFNFELDLILPETRFPEIVIPLVLNCVLLIFLPKACILSRYTIGKRTQIWIGQYQNLWNWLRGVHIVLQWVYKISVQILLSFHFICVIKLPTSGAFYDKCRHLVWFWGFHSGEFLSAGHMARQGSAVGNWSRGWGLGADIQGHGEGLGRAKQGQSGPLLPLGLGTLLMCPLGELVVLYFWGGSQAPLCLCPSRVAWQKPT